jgi:hypothetical protein
MGNGQIAYLSLAFKLHNSTFPPNFLGHLSFHSLENANPQLALFSLIPFHFLSPFNQTFN